MRITPDGFRIVGPCGAAVYRYPEAIARRAVQAPPSLPGLSSVGAVGKSTTTSGPG